MISDEVRSLRAIIDLCQSTKGGMDRRECHLILDRLSDIHAQALQLEGAQVPRRQRMTDDHLNGNVVLLPVYPRNEAVLP